MDEKGEEIEDSKRLFELPVKNKINNLRSLKVIVFFSVCNFLESHFFDSFGRIHRVNTNSVLVRTASDFDILRTLVRNLKRDNEIQV